MPYKDIKKQRLYMIERRRNIKLRAVEFMGGKCQRCGYSKCVGALTFHHNKPSQKDFGIARGGYTRAWSKILKELKKCILLCANCHAETHDDFIAG